jgi:hypothetical protein
MEKQDEERVRQIARGEALKCIAEENTKNAKGSIEFMKKIRLPKRR